MPGCSYLPFPSFQTKEWLKEAIRKAEDKHVKEALTQARAAAEAAMQCMPPMKMEKREFQD